VEKRRRRVEELLLRGEPDIWPAACRFIPQRFGHHLHSQASDLSHRREYHMKIGVNPAIAATVFLFPLTALAQLSAAPNSDARPTAVGLATPPAQAVSAGFTTTLVNQDFSRGILDLGCDGKSQKHFWNQGMEWDSHRRHVTRSASSLIQWPGRRCLTSSG
jgi:hypothetical protein